MVNTSFALLSKLSAIALIIALTACSPQAPQRPSQRSGQTAEPDSVTLAMVELHQRLAEAADVELTNYIRNHQGQWFAQDDGSWVMGVAPQPDTRHQTLDTRHQTPDTRHQTLDTLYALRLITRTLEGRLLSDVQGEYELGKCQLPQAVENILSNTGHQGGFTVLAPWYVAYGSQGNDAVPQYQNVIIEVYIL